MITTLVTILYCFGYITTISGQRDFEDSKRCYYNCMGGDDTPCYIQSIRATLLGIEYCLISLNIILGLLLILVIYRICCTNNK